MAGAQPLSLKTKITSDSPIGRTAANAKKIAGSVRIRKPAGYSRYVSFMKVFLPIIALGLVGLIFLWPQIYIGNNQFSISFKNILMVNPEDPNMVNARFVGTDKKNQPFSITADLAKNIILNNSAIELEMPKADIGIKDGTWLVVTANTGIYDQKGKTLELIGAVNLFHDSGYEFNTEKANIDLGNGIATSKAKITGQGPFGNLTAEGFRIENKGMRFIFTGKAKLVIHPNAPKILK
jgi:lipopolysaccharide export system protein LptC